MNQEIFKIIKLTDHSYIINNIKLKNNHNHKKILTKKYTIYQYKNLRLIIDENNEKECVKLVPINYKITDSIIVNSYKITTMPLTSFPFISKYDFVLERTIETYNYKNKSYAYITETNTKTNDSVTYIKVTDFNDNELQDLSNEILN